MADHDDDAELRERFEKLKQRDAQIAPSFQRLMRAAEAPHKKRSRWAWAAVSFAASVLVLFGLAISVMPRRSPSPMRPRAKLPLDFLLQMPSAEATQSAFAMPRSVGKSFLE